MPNSQRLLELALKGLEADRVRIDNEIAEIRGQLRAGSPTRTRIRLSSSKTTQDDCCSPKKNFGRHEKALCGDEGTSVEILRPFSSGA